MAVNKVNYGSRTLIDISNTTATADKIAVGYGAYGADGEWMSGTAEGGQGIHCGTSEPASSLGSDGDLYFLMASGDSVERYPAALVDTSHLNSTSNLERCIGVSADDGASTQNVYSSGQSVEGTADYSFDLSDIPDNATIKSVACRVRGHEENASRSVCTFQLYSGSTAKGEASTASGTSNAIYTLTTGSWTRAELDELILRMTVGYYGGLIAGATLTVEYETEPQYTANFVGNASGWSLTSDQMYQKNGGSWAKVSSVSLGDAIERK